MANTEMVISCKALFSSPVSQVVPGTVASVWPSCMRAIAAATVLVKETDKLILE